MRNKELCSKRRPSGDHSLDLRETAQSQPGPQIGFELSVSREQELSLFLRSIDRGVSHPDFGHRPKVRREVQIDIETRIDRAQVGFLIRLDDQPPVALLLLEIGENDLN